MAPLGDHAGEQCVMLLRQSVEAVNGALTVMVYSGQWAKTTNYCIAYGRSKAKPSLLSKPLDDHGRQSIGERSLYLLE